MFINKIGFNNWLKYKLNKTIKYILIYLSYSKDTVNIIWKLTYV